MTIEQFAQSEAAWYAWRQMGHIGDIDSMLAVGHALRNRAEADGVDLLAVLSEAEKYEPHAEPHVSHPVLEDQRLRRFLYEFDRVSKGTADDISNGGRYWYEPGRNASEFTRELLSDPINHPRCASVGTILFFR